MIWFIMEILFIFFIGFVSMNLSYGIVELMMKYYITQVFISLIFISTLLILAFNLVFYFNFFLLVVLMMKLGMFPFHFWIIMILGKLNWFSFFVLMTFMKLIPLLMFYYMSSALSINLILLMSAVSGSVLGLSNLVVQKLMGYSSLIHLCWLLVSLMFAIHLFFFYFSCYFVMMLVLSLFFNQLNIYYINQVKTSSSSFFSKLFLFSLILSLGGFPPFMGFVVKWVLVNCMLLFNMKVLMLAMVSFSLFSVIFYLELFFYIMMVGSFSISWYSKSTAVYSVFFFLILVFYSSIFFYF